MACAAPIPDTSTKDTSLAALSSAVSAPNRASPPSPSPSPSPQLVESADLKKLGPDTAKRTKHTRVHKREQELFGLITPIFLPLLDAGTSPTKKKKEKQSAAVLQSSPSSDHGSLTRDGETGNENSGSRSTSNDGPMERGEGAEAADGPKEATKETPKENKKPDAMKKSKRAALKKSSLRHNNTPRPRRKRVSLVIDDQIVLPADNIPELPLTSPTETTASTNSNSNSTTSLEDYIDPRLVSPHDTPASSHDVHHGPVHHSLDLPRPLPSTSPTKHTSRVISDSPPSLQHEPAQTTARNFLEPSPPRQETIPQYGSRSPAYANEAAMTEVEEEEEEDFSTYVGGISGSGVDNVDQAGSYGYPSSLGASYLESYMKSRPLSVRVASAEKAGLAEDEKRALINADEDVKEDDIDLDFGKVEDADQSMEIMGDMEGF